MFEITFDNRTEELQEILEELKINVKEIDACAIVSIEGLPIAAKIPDEHDETIIAAMTAALLNLGMKTVANLNRGDLLKISIEGTEGQIISQSAGENAVLTISTSKEAKLGLIFMELERATQKIKEIMG